MGSRGPRSKAEREMEALSASRGTSHPRSVSVVKPPRALSTHGQSLWDRIVVEFDVSSSAAAELLCQACQALDRAQDCAQQIARDGLMIDGREHPLVKHELASRAFSAKIVQRLGLDSI